MKILSLKLIALFLVCGGARSAFANEKACDAIVVGGRVESRFPQYGAYVANFRQGDERRAFNELREVLRTAEDSKQVASALLAFLDYKNSAYAEISNRIKWWRFRSTLNLWDENSFLRRNLTGTWVIGRRQEHSDLEIANLVFGFALALNRNAVKVKLWPLFWQSGRSNFGWGVHRLGYIEDAIADTRETEARLIDTFDRLTRVVPNFKAPDVIADSPSMISIPDFYPAVQWAFVVAGADFAFNGDLTDYVRPAGMALYSFLALYHPVRDQFPRADERFRSRLNFHFFAANTARAFTLLGIIYGGYNLLHWEDNFRVSDHQTEREDPADTEPPPNAAEQIATKNGMIEYLRNRNSVADHRRMIEPSNPAYSDEIRANDRQIQSLQKQIRAIRKKEEERKE